MPFVIREEVAIHDPQAADFFGVCGRPGQAVGRADIVADQVDRLGDAGRRQQIVDELGQVWQRCVVVGWRARAAEAGQIGHQQAVAPAQALDHAAPGIGRVEQAVQQQRRCAAALVDQRDRNMFDCELAALVT